VGNTSGMLAVAGYLSISEQFIFVFATRYMFLFVGRPLSFSYKCTSRLSIVNSSEVLAGYD
jgi:hypothetical protein